MFSKSARALLVCASLGSAATVVACGGSSPATAVDGGPGVNVEVATPDASDFSDGGQVGMDGNATDGETLVDVGASVDDAVSSLANTLLAGHPIYSLVEGAPYTGRIVLRAKAADTAVHWAFGGTSCANARAVTCLPAAYGIEPASDSAHDWRCEVTASTLGSGNVIVRACDGDEDPAVSIDVVALPAKRAPYVPGVFLQQLVGDSAIGATEAKYLAGANLLVYWWQLQPTIGTFDDSTLAFQASWSHVVLLVKTGSEVLAGGANPDNNRNGTPGWLMNAAPNVGLGRPIHSDNIGKGPYPWDEVYQDLAENMMAHVAAVVGDNPKLSAVYLAGATSHYNEMILPGSTDFTNVVAPTGLTADEPVEVLDPDSCTQYVQAWERAIDSMNTQFQVQIITPLDDVPACTTANDPYNALKATATTPFSPSTRAFGTVNLGYYADSSTTTQQTPTYWNANAKFADRKGPNPTSEYWEMGPFKMDPGITGSGPPTPAEMATMATRVTYVLGAAAWGSSDTGAYFDTDAVTILNGTWVYGAPVADAVCSFVQGYSRWWPNGTKPASCP